MRRPAPLLLALLLALLVTGCIPYAVGTTARPVAKGEFQPTLLAYTVPNGIEEIGGDDTSLGYVAADFEGRWGLSDVSDIGLRVPAGSGAIVNYKRMLNRVNDPDARASAFMLGAGIVNFESHAFFEAAFIASGAISARIPYGGARIMHVIPIRRGAVEDDPTFGVFGGMRFRINETFSMSPELGIYHDRPALGLRDNSIIFVPSLSFHWR
jgi:hypothetical protein